MGRALLLFLATVVLTATGTSSIAQQPIETPPVRHPRAGELHELAAKILPPRARTRPREDVAVLRRALESLEAAIVAAQSDPSLARLAVLRQRSEAAQGAFAALRSRLSAAGGQELATDLEGKFQPLWAGLDQALVVSNRRAESLATARAHVETAVSRRVEPRGSAVTIVPLIAQE